ncbi:putative mitochondrial pyruvate carrier 1 [Iris pallida]|uniref:Mitochondrial pyruvate carrier 1 n=1 Tax=Iris pallida TaxID=29817 RepID=A0AAX6GC17_IRIPA|nr:putative mitochondrial pyruvate carrier 1 [Iris pallida]
MESVREVGYVKEGPSEGTRPCVHQSSTGGTSTRPWSCSNGSTMPSSRRRLGRSTLLWKKFSVSLFFLIFSLIVCIIYFTKPIFLHILPLMLVLIFSARVWDKILGNLWLFCRLG